MEYEVTLTVRAAFGLSGDGPSFPESRTVCVQAENEANAGEAARQWALADKRYANATSVQTEVVNTVAVEDKYCGCEIWAYALPPITGGCTLCGRPIRGW